MKTENEFIEIPEEYIDRLIGNYNPVVIITTNNAQGQTNAAPFAMCMEVCHNPPFLAFGVGKNKDTYHNVKRHGEFVVNVPGKEILKHLMITAKRYPPEVNELVEAGLHELPAKKVAVSRVKECKLHFECVVEWIKEAGDHFIVLGKVMSASGHQTVITEDFRLKLKALKPVHYLGRGTDVFFEIGTRIDMKRFR
jgi:flavin reductase (DIM6/NTAB) family NADH-FMN oxidoreductase RutF